MSLKLNSSGGGSVTLNEPVTANNRTLSLPDNNGTLVSTADTGSVTPSMLSQKLTSGTSVASTSGTSIDFTGIPSWVKRITVLLNGVSLSSTANLWVQIGSGSVVTSGYVGNRAYSLNTTVQGNGGFTAAISEVPRNNAASATTGTITLTNFSGNTWVGVMVSAEANTLASWSAGSITLSGTLDRIRITSSTGTDTFDAGSINILYEG